MDVIAIFGKFSEFINTFGSPIVIAIILFVIVLLLKLKPKTLSCPQRLRASV